MKKLLSALTVGALLLGVVPQNVAEGARINIADREMKDPASKEGPFAERINAILGTGGQEISGRVKLGLLLHSDGHILVDDDVKKVIYQRLRNKFPKQEFAIIKATDVATVLLERSESKRKMLPEMTESDYVFAMRQMAYDYLMVISFIHDEHWNAPVMKLDEGAEETVWMKTRLVDPKIGGYLYRNDFAVSGTSMKNHVRCRLQVKQVDSVTQEFLDDLSIDYRDEDWFRKESEETAAKAAKAEEAAKAKQAEDAKRAHEASIDAILEGAL
ncbi:MAG: hypothetical protein J6O04_01335 [Selenomonadaceae bacterium]|nr:hypothetical protein [Selenomonadaceae bacterium]